ncbi:MAG: hypothetical protein NTU47_06305 [Ignavibacteriales bacterium]|nr:hypothetical protein [Ignavibacteriales bacterium]
MSLILISELIYAKFVSELQNVRDRTSLLMTCANWTNCGDQVLARELKEDY